MKKTYPVIDLAKFIFAFAVVTLHAKPFVNLSSTVNWYIESFFSRLAVPFFYVSSSFFLSLKIREKGFSVMKPYRLTLLPKLLFWGSLALILMFYPSYQESQSIVKTLLYLAKNAIFYPRGSMWFMLALIVSSIILGFTLRKRIIILPMFVTALILYAFGLICCTYNFVVDGTLVGKIVEKYLWLCISPSNGVCLFIFMLIGYIMSSEKIMQLSKKTTSVMFAIGMLLLIAESTVLCGKSKQCYYFISHLILIPAMILLMTKSSLVISSHKTLREFSVVLFCSHSFFSRILGDYIGMSYGIFRYIITISLSMIAWFVTRNSKNKTIRKLLY